jgi:hypothetical protein
MSLALLLVAAGGIAAYTAIGPAPVGKAVESPHAVPETLGAGAGSRLTVPGSPPESAFGLVGDVAVGDGRTFVLDALNQEIGVFSPGGERTAVLGRPGPGPGEFMGPVALAVDDVGGGLYVLDERKQGIDVFDGGGSAWKRMILLDFPAADLCFLSGRLYVLGGRSGFLLHEVSAADGRVLRSFAPDPDSENPLLRGYRASGYLGCAPSGEIAFLPSLRPEVLRFSAERGNLFGIAPIPGYVAVRVRQTESGGMQFDAPGKDGHDYGSSILPLPGGDWLIQVGRLRKGSTSQHEFESVRSYRLSARDGQVRPLSPRLPRVLAAGSNLVYAVETSPYPAVRIVPTPLSDLLP